VERGTAEPGTFLRLLSDGDREALLTLGGRRRFPSGQRLMHQGEPGDRVLILLEGHAKATFVDPDGREVVLSFRGPGDVLGELSFIHEQPRSSSVTAIEPVVAQALAASEFRSYLEACPRAALTVIDVLSRRFRDANLMRIQFASQDSAARIAMRLLELCERYGTRAPEGIDIRLPVTQADLGSWTATSRAGVTSALRTLREQGWIATKRRRLVVLDVESLQRLAGSTPDAQK
jgi:CRP-like cAMP-binding protein